MHIELQYTKEKEFLTYQEVAWRLLSVIPSAFSHGRTRRNCSPNGKMIIEVLPFPAAPTDADAKGGGWTDITLKSSWKQKLIGPTVVVLHPPKRKLAPFPSCRLFIVEDNSLRPLILAWVRTSLSHCWLLAIKIEVYNISRTTIAHVLELAQDSQFLVLLHSATQTFSGRPHCL